MCNHVNATNKNDTQTFMLRQEVLKLYRSFLRTAYQLPDHKQRSDVVDWVRSDFKANRGIDPQNDEQIKSLLYNGQKMLQELRQSMDLASA
eukprot:TCALIF_05708-PA protein Name:"Similar to lyrm2 LYR motif-containing protein 2 (Xenopus tropicalis)" AED:0.54 eAED:0.54 QI:0/0/0/0.33/1/1/3/0/90